MSNKTKRPFVWRGSQLSLDIVPHDNTDQDGKGDLAPTLQVQYRARIPLNGQTLAEQREHAQKIAKSINEGLSALPTVDDFRVWFGETLRPTKHRGRIHKSGNDTELQERK